MADKPQGSSDSLFFIGLIGIVILMFFGSSWGIGVEKKESKSVASESSRTLSNRESLKESSSFQGEVSPWKGKVNIQKGTAGSEYQPYKEYITLRTTRLKDGETINLTGWSLSNGKGARFYQIGDKQVAGSSDRVFIPQASRVFLTKGVNYQSPIIVGKNSRVVLLTGNVPNRLPFAVTNFQVNKCSGYIESMENYKFFPPINLSCPDPEDEVRIASLEDSCYKFIRSLRMCHTPEFPERTRVGDSWEYGYVDGVAGLSNQCKAILKTHFNYESCVALHGTDPDFLQNEWRVFLNRSWELWAKNRETITLYDNLGRVVDELSY